MTMYDPDNDQHMAYLGHHKAQWTPEKEAALQHQFALDGLKGVRAKELAQAKDRAAADAE